MPKISPLCQGGWHSGCETKKCSCKCHSKLLKMIHARPAGKSFATKIETFDAMLKMKLGEKLAICTPEHTMIFELVKIKLLCLSGNTL